MSYTTVTGNLTRDPELRYTATGIAVASFGLAEQKRKKDGDQWVDDDPIFWKVTCWRGLGENASESLEKGDRVIVTGKVGVSEWETKEGEKRFDLTIDADDVGPSLKWATAETTKTTRSDRSVANKPSENDPSEEPF